MRAPLTTQDLEFLQTAIDLAAQHMRADEGGPFGAVVTRGSEIVAQGWNRVTSANDPTAHAEVTAIREAARVLGSFQLRGCVLYSSCEPCPMCLGAAYWARVDRIVYAGTRGDASAAGFDDAEIYEELARPPEARKLPMQEALRKQAQKLFTDWLRLPNRQPY